MWPWRPRGPAICYLQAGDLGKWWCNLVWVQRPGDQGSWRCKSQSRSKGLRIQGWWCTSWSENQESRCLRAGEDGCPSSSREQILPSCCCQALHGLGDAMHTGEGGSSLLSLSIQVLISSQNTLMDTPQNTVYQLSGHPWAQSSWYIKWTITAGRTWKGFELRRGAALC